MKNELKSWNWKYGMTPTFSITRPITLPPCLANNKTVNVSVEVINLFFKSYLTSIIRVIYGKNSNSEMIHMLS